MPVADDTGGAGWVWREGGRLAATLFGLAAAVAFERQVVHGQMIVPVLRVGLSPEPWMWASLFIPELVVCFLVGWQLRGWRSILVFAAAGAVVRQGTLAFLAAAAPPAAEAIPSARVLEAPAFVLAYLLALALASWSARTPGPTPAEPGAEG